MDKAAMEFVIAAMILWPGALLIGEIWACAARRRQDKWDTGFSERSRRRHAIWAAEGGFPRLLASDMLDSIEQAARIGKIG